MEESTRNILAKQKKTAHAYSQEIRKYLTALHNTGHGTFSQNQEKKRLFIKQFKEYKDYASITASIGEVIVNLDFRLLEGEFEEVISNLILFESYLTGQIIILKRPEQNVKIGNSFELVIPNSSISDVQTFIKDYRNALEPLILDEEVKGKMQLVSSRPGSAILEFTTGVEAAIPVIASVVYGAAYILRQRKKQQLLEQELTGFKLDNELKKTTLDAVKAKINELTDVEAKAIQKKHFKDEDHERLAQIKTSLKLLGDTYLKGGAVLPGSGLKDYLKDQFPDMNKLEDLVSQVKKLPKGK